VYQNVDFDTYAAWPAINHSILRHFHKTPAHVRYEMTHEDETKAKALGYLIHVAVLEPDRFKAEFAAAPKVDKRTKVGKADWARAEKANPGKELTKAEDYEAALCILQNIQEHGFARELLRSAGSQELSLCWRDKATGVLCKGRLDRLTTSPSNDPVVVDLKTIGRPASTFAFQQAIETYGYHEQAAHYLSGLLTLMPEMPLPKFAWVVVETKAPHLCRVFEAEDEALAIGGDKMAKALATFKECRETDFWPGWGDGMDTAGLPPWVYKRYDVE
jgi:exodeoxyribonuclease VIII